MSLSPPLLFMKRLLLIFSLIVVFGCSNAQNSIPLTIPPYRILTTDSVYLTPANLKKNTPTMIVYFSPDCSHCQHMMYELKPVMKSFSKAQVIMITFVQQIKAIQVFSRDFDLKKYPNFIVGTEGYTYKVQKFYQVKTTPFIAIYDRKGKLVKSYEKPPKAEELAEVVKKL